METEPEKTGSRRNILAGKITSLQVQQRNPQRVNVYLDGEFAFGLSRIVAAWLQVGQELNTEKIADLQAQDTREVSYQKALRMLEVRGRSSAEVRQKLLQRGTPAEVVEDVLDRLSENRLVDDAQFAQAWVENRSTFRPRSRRALAFELRQHGVEQAEIEHALEELDDELLAEKAARLHIRRWKALPHEEFHRKLSGFLGRRGFSYPVVRSVVDRLWQEQQVKL
jgi:regulatory protein